MQRFGEKLHTLRKQRGLTLRELAAALEINAFSYISEIENGKKKPPTEFVIKVARFFNVSADQLLMDDLELE
jgi:transcriptional regulator with XRE-family HTH domain